MKRYILDTNTVSNLIKGHPVVAKHLVAVPMAALFISAITEAELYFGLAKRPEAKKLHLAVTEFLRRVDVLPWEGGATAECYGVVRAQMEKQGKILGQLDLLIATQALSENAVLVTNDKAFALVAGLIIEDWTLL